MAVESEEVGIGRVKEMELENGNFLGSKLDLKTQIEYAAENGAEKYIIIFNPTQDKISRSHPKLLKESFKNKVTKIGNIDEIIHTRNGKILAITKNLNTAKELVKINSLLLKEVIPSLQYETMTTRFLLFSIPTEENLDDVKKDIEDENQVKVHSITRFTKKHNNRYINTETVLITIYGRILPQYIKIWMTRNRINLFVDKPRQCQKCFGFDHPTKFCKQMQLCVRCGKSHDSECKETTCCLLCKGNHMANNKDCEFYKKEEEILKFKAINGLTTNEARRIWKPRTSYATVTRVNTEQNNTTKIEMVDLLNKYSENLNKQFQASLQAALQQQANYFMKAFQNITSTIEKMQKSITDIKEEDSDLPIKCRNKPPKKLRKEENPQNVEIQKNINLTPSQKEEMDQYFSQKAKTSNSLYLNPATQHIQTKSNDMSIAGKRT